MTENNRSRKRLFILAAFITAAFFYMIPARVFAMEPESPSVSVSSRKASQITVSWTSVEGAAEYYVYRCDRSSPYQRIAVTAETTYEDNTVENDVAYEYSVTAVVEGTETAFNNKGAVGYSAYKAPHVYGWNVTDLSPRSFTVSGKVSYEETASSIYLPVWTEKNGQDDLRWYIVPVTNNTFSYTIDTSKHGSESGVYVLDPYLNGTSMYCATPLWVEVPSDSLQIISPAVVDLSAQGFTAAASVQVFSSQVKSARAEIWTAYQGKDDLETVTASYDSKTGIISCPVLVSKHNNEGRLYYVRFTVTDNAGSTKSLFLSAYIPSDENCMNLTVIDLGESSIGGSATLLTSGGKALLIDTGRSESGKAVVTCLKQHKVTQIDILITHGDGDHVGVAQAIADAGIAIGNVYTDDHPADVMWDELDRTASMAVFRKYGQIRPIPETLTIGGATLTTIGPEKYYSLYDAKANGMSQANANSYWFMITNGTEKVLINGDSELASSREMVQSGRDISADVYIMGHHGATGSLDESILNAISPEFTAASGRITEAISSDTVRVLKNAGIPYFFTSSYGSIDITFRGPSTTINTEKNTDSAPGYYDIMWKLPDGSCLETDNWVTEGTVPSYDGQTPVKAQTAQYTYTFAGWSTDGSTVLSVLPAVTANATYIAVFKSTLRTYPVTWLNADGSVLKTENLAYGSMPKYDTEPGDPFHDGLSHSFVGWVPEIQTVTGKASYKASFVVHSPKLKRLAGEDRYDTSQEILKEAFPDASQNRIVLTGGISYQNAVTGIALAGGYRCPLLITQTDHLTDATREEIERLAGDSLEVIILGDENIVSERVEAVIEKMDKVNSVIRIAGQAGSDEEMALEVYRFGIREGLWTDSNTVILAASSDFPDALSITPYAYAARTPVLLTNSDGTFSEETFRELAECGVERTILAGGEAMVLPEAVERLTEEGICCIRLSGEDRYLTTQQIFYWVLGEMEAPFQPEVLFSEEYVGFATGFDFPDAITSANLLGWKNGPLLLAGERADIIEILETTLSGREADIQKAYVFGGNAVIPDNLMCRIATIITPASE